MTYVRVSAALLAVVATVATPAMAKKEPQLTGLELQQIQARDFEASKKDAFAAVMTVLQDSGYRIGNADYDTGLVTAMASTKTKMTWMPFIGFGTSKKTPVVSAYIEDKSPTLSRIRLNFVMGKIKANASFGGVTDEDPINDPKTYQEAFEKISQAIFVRQAMNAPTAPPPAALPAAPVAVSATTPR
jgi:hypothetical protein